MVVLLSLVDMWSVSRGGCLRADWVRDSREERGVYGYSVVGGVTNAVVQKRRERELRRRTRQLL